MKGVSVKIKMSLEVKMVRMATRRLNEMKSVVWLRLYFSTTVLARNLKKPSSSMRIDNPENERKMARIFREFISEFEKNKFFRLSVSTVPEMIRNNAQRKGKIK